MDLEERQGAESQDQESRVKEARSEDMARYSAETWDASDLQRFLHEQGHEHLRVRKHGALLVIESGPDDDPVNHARFRRDTVHYWTLEMATHTGKWERTGLRGTLDDLRQMLVDTFGWTLTAIV